jgi:hypothetical protein
MMPAAFPFVAVLRRQSRSTDVKMWEDQPLSIFPDAAASSVGFHARVAQYEFHSKDALKQKLAQFPSGTKPLFIAGITGKGSNHL